MPLRDHFHSPFNDRYRWDTVHGGLPMVIATHLNSILPEQYEAGPTAHLGSIMEVDVGTMLGPSADWNPDASSGGGGVVAAPKVWTPPKPTLKAKGTWSAVDDYEVKIYDTNRALELVAAIEIVSPSNKNRPRHRRLFAGKCAAMLANDVSVVIIDFVTERRANLYAEMLGLIEVEDENLSDPPEAISAVSCLQARENGRRRLLTWYYPLGIGQPLPTLPLWLNDQLAVPLELEPLYEQTLKSLRIR